MTISATVQSRLIDKIWPNPHQPRKIFSALEIGELADSIATNGLLQPITITPDGLIVAGERRFRACKQLGWRKIDCIVKAFTPEQVATAAIIENLQRTDITPLEEAKAFKRMLDQGFADDIKGLAAKLGIKQPFRIAERMALLKLTSQAQSAFSSGVVGASAAWYLSHLESAQQEQLLGLIMAGKCETDPKLRAAYEAVGAIKADQVSLDIELPNLRVQRQINALQSAIHQASSLLSTIVLDETLDHLKSQIPGHQADDMTQVLQNVAQVTKQLQHQLEVVSATANILAKN